MGCLTRVGCLVVVAAAAAGAYWVYGDRLPSELRRASRNVGNRVSQADSARRASRDSAERAVGWVSVDTLTVDRVLADKVRTKLGGLARDNGPTYVTLDAREAASLLAPALERALPRSASRTQVAFHGETMLLRAEVDLRDFAGSGALGALLGGALGGRDRLRAEGTLDEPIDGHADFRLTALEVKGVSVPTQLIPTLVRIIRERSDAAAPSNAQPAASTAVLPDNALRITLPASVADVRVRNGKLTLYRAAP